MIVATVGVLRGQISKLIPLIEQQNQNTPSKMLELILRRYKKADEILATEEIAIDDLKKICIAGSARAYLDSASDYMNPILEEMGIAEKMLKETIDEMKNGLVVR
ncbi:hypothetical protein [Azotosporobacter soli]|uniref:hypothetical protein n=1 Tax=Azotosporobacter soli TaxID=3055040 RepID=UPI0031FF25A3